MELAGEGYSTRGADERKIENAYKNLNRWKLNDAFSFMRRDGLMDEHLLLDVLAREVPKQKRLNRQLKIAVVTLCVISLLWLGAGAVLLSKVLSIQPAPWLFFAPMILLLIAIFLGMAACSEATPTRVQKRAALCLCLLCETLEDVHSVGPLLEGLEFWFGDMYQSKWSNAACFALFQLLPKVQPADTDWLTERQIGVLERLASHLWTTRRRWMSRQDWGDNSKSLDGEFYVAVFAALSQVGRASALPVLKKLAALKVSSRAKEAVRNSAQSAAEAVKARCGV